MSATPLTAADLAPGDGRAARSWRIVLALTSHEHRLAARRGESLLATFVVPAAVLLFFGGLGVLPTGTASAVDFVLPGTMALAVIASSLVALGIATAYERAYGVLKRLGGSPASRAMVVTAKTIATLVVEAVQAVLLIALAGVVLGWRPGDGAQLGVVVAALILGTAAFAGLGLLLAGTLRAEATLALTNGLFLVSLLVGGVVVPISRLPEPLAGVARALPGAALADALRIGLGALAGDPTPPLLLLAGWALILVTAAAWRFRWD
jgi:ABC-2 type transport system permease protein